MFNNIFISVLNPIFSFRVNDCVLKVNNIDLTNVEHNIAVQAINHAEILNLVRMLVKILIVLVK